VSSTSKGILLFAAGMAFALLVIGPAREPARPAPPRADAVALPDPLAPARQETGRAPGAPTAPAAPRQVGLPADSGGVAPPFNPHAGQRRALARVLDGLERNPPEVAPEDPDPAQAAAVGRGLRAALSDLASRGEPR
jgi:hypothetical protein